MPGVLGVRHLELDGAMRNYAWASRAFPRVAPSFLQCLMTNDGCLRKP